ncbi:MAG: DNA topoisomerase IV, partial [Glutamicibacter sp.]
QGPARASSTAGVVRALPTEYGKRDGSGAPLAQSVNIIGGTIAGGHDALAAPAAQDLQATARQEALIPEPTKAKAAPAITPGEDALPFDDGGVIL